MAVTPLGALVAAELNEPLAPPVRAFAAAIAARHPGARAVLYYGSTLREARLDGLMLDFYLIVDDYQRAFGSRLLALANRLVPPNVFPAEHDGLVAKYAVLSQADLDRLGSRRTRSVSVWARFAQPSRLAWCADEPSARRTIDAVAGCAPALFSAARPCLPDRADPLALWRAAFALTYAAELRAERSGRAASVVDADSDRYRAFTLPALAAADIDATSQGGEILFGHTLSPAERRRGAHDWAQRRRVGKALTLLRLGKASFTYAGGIDYLAWKIGRHSGQPVPLRAWQRRWPLLGAAALLPRLLARGAVR